MLEFGDQTFDTVPLSVRFLVQGHGVNGVASVWNHGLHALVQERIADFIAVVSFVGYRLFRMAVRWHGFHQFFKRCRVVLLPWRQHNGDGSVLVRGGNV